MSMHIKHIELEKTVELVEQWMHDYVRKPNMEIGRRGPVCPFVEPSQRADLCEIRVRLLGPTPSAMLVEEMLRCALDEFDQLPWRGSNRTLRALLVVLPDIPLDRLHLLDEAHVRVKPECVRRGLMIGQFHSQCDERAARNPAFRVSLSPVPIVAIRSMAVHDVLFLRGHLEWFEEYVKRFGARYRNARGPDELFVELYEKACAEYGISP
jgi:hypothetical protein